MTNPCTRFDEWMAAGEVERLEAHAAECPTCREELGQWNDLSAVARTLHETWESPALWPAIEKSLAARRNVVAFRRVGRVWAAAAAIVLIAGLGAVAWQLLSARRTASLQEIAAVGDVESAEEAYRRSIERLEKIARPKLDDRAATPLMISYKEKLMLLEDAIAECDANIETNRQNPNLRKQLLALYDEKSRTLQQLMRESSNVQ